MRRYHNKTTFKESKWKLYLRDKKVGWNKSWQYLEQMRKTSDENRAKPCKDTHSCSETFHMEHLHSQPELTYILGLKNAEPVKDRTLQVFILPEYS